jgi:5-methylcytosine-specific restriction protein A
MGKPPHLCTCGKIVGHGVQCPCKLPAIRARKAKADANRPTASQRGYNHEWRKARVQWLKVYPTCTHAGCSAKATTVDHITPHKGDDKLFWDKTNWQSLCTTHHVRHKQRLERNQ